MEVISLSSTNFIGLSAIYASDKNIKFNQNIIYTEQGIDLPKSAVFSDINDNTTNNFSSLFLTKQQPLTSVAYIENLPPIVDSGFTSYLAVYGTGGISDISRFMVVQEPDPTTSIAAVSMSGINALIDNRYFFTIVFESDTLCKIEHVVDGIARYLTADNYGQLFFAFDTNTDSLQEASPQLFYYTYDREYNYIVFGKDYSNIAWYLAYNPTANNLTLVQAVTGSDTVPYPQESIFTCITRSVEPNDTLLVDPWVSYNPDFFTNTQNILPEKSVNDVNSNLLINSEYLQQTNNTISVNALSLKNTNTPENLQSRNNPFQSNKSPYFVENDVEFRDYKKLYTGSNQTLGNDNITLGYESYTTNIILPKDKISYFHIPQTLFPFSQLNINDSGLIEAGAIAGDHPVKSDKIFKKQASAKYTSPFGTSSDEDNGMYLCSWLSGGANPTNKPLWVDRYYNPSKITFINALTSRTLKAISYNTVFDSLVQQVGYIPDTDEVFDKPSDLIFEPGTYYAYHHYGPKDVANYIQTLQNVLVEKGITKYFYTDSSINYADASSLNEYIFNGQQYGMTNSLSGIQESNQFTLIFDMYNSDWSKPFANQIIGNFQDDGFGLFNENLITPTLFVNTASSTDILNTDFYKIKTVNYPAIPLAHIRTGTTNNYNVVCSDGYLRQYTSDDILLRQTFSPFLTNILGYTNTDSTGYILCSAAPASFLFPVDLKTNTIQQALPTNTVAYFAPGAGSLNTNLANTINYYNSAFYFTPGTISRRVNDTLYYLADKNTSIIEWSDITTAGTTVKTLTSFKYGNQNGYIIDFNIDFDGNIWILSNQNTYYKYTQDRAFLLSGTLTSNTSSVRMFGLSGNGKVTSFSLPYSGSNSPYDYNVITQTNKQLQPVFDYTINNNNIVFTSPPVSGVNYTVQTTLYQDTFKNYKINFISEFTNGIYNTDAIVARTGYLTQYNTLTSNTCQAYQFVLIDTYGGVLSSTFYTTPTANLVLTNSNYLRGYVQDTYPAANLNAKVTTINLFNESDTQTSELIFNLSALDPGYHNFAIRFDAYHGYFTMFVDGRQVQNVQFTPRKYKFSNLLYRPFVIGSSSLNNSKPLFEYIKKNAFLAENIKIKNFYLYDTPLNDCDIMMHARNNMTIQDLYFDMPCGRRNYLEEIERYFKANIPGIKSTQYNIIIRNTGITDTSLRAALEDRINLVLKNSAPAYAKLNKIKWVN